MKTHFIFQFLLCSLSFALEIRSASAERHGRFALDPNGSKIHNPGAYYGAANYAALGYEVNGPRQFALITPEHVLLANHFGGGGTVEFINQVGEKVTRTLGQISNIPNDEGGFSDLAIRKLSAPLPDSFGVSPFAVADFPRESSYFGNELVVFGQTLRAGRGTILNSFSDSEIPGAAIGKTRTYAFDYNEIEGNRDDAYAVLNDSGSPSFVVTNGRPAVVGLHLGIGQSFGVRRTFDTFVPHYRSEINDILEPEGYRLIPTNPRSVSLRAASLLSPLHQLESGTISLTLRNRSGREATNARFELQFPANSVPTSITAPGWVVANIAPGIFQLRRGVFPRNTSSEITLNYDEVPVVSEIVIQTSHKSDGSPQTQGISTFPVQETFAGFVSHLAEKGANDDPDGDGLTNLLEYALGGDPAINSTESPEGANLSPHLEQTPNGVTFVFRKRTDADARGLTYTVLYSEDLSPNSFSEVKPTSFRETQINNPAPDSAFQMINTNMTTERMHFFRLKVELEQLQ